MKHFLKRSLFFVGIILLNTLQAQTIGDPVTWEFSSSKINECEYELLLTGTIEKDWHVYSLTLPGDDGPMPAVVTFTENEDYELIGKTTEGKPITEYDSIFEMNVAYFKNVIVFKQKVKLKSASEIVIKGTYEYQACIEDKCIFPPENSFEFKLTGTKSCVSSGVTLVPHNTANVSSSASASGIDKVIPETEETVNDSSTQVETETIINSDADTDDDTSLIGKAWWLIFLTGFAWGFAAIFTPCVFPLIPMNVSFFLKRSKTKAMGKMNALIYVLAIISIFVSLGLGISAFFGGGALNSFATSVGFNSVIFVLLLVFAASFLGAFEIVLPSSFVNKIDQQSDRGGFVGIFFMALTLVVVSFSCTGPMIGNALVAASTSGNTTGAFWSMFGFSVGLALPFGFFAFFPSLLNAIPKSGGWLNTVKVVLGFLELALALKFASNVDLVYQMGILTREVFISFWIVIFGLMSIYLMGGFKTAHDSDTPYLSVTRLFFAIIAFTMTVYILPGLWGAPLKLLSGILPPLEYSESPHGFGAAGNQHTNANNTFDPEFAKYIEVNKNGIVHFKNDYEHALAYAKKTNKPLLIDFTGHACANCRKTEDYIWPDPEVTKRLNDDLVLVSLYVDDKRSLDPKDFQEVFWYGKERVITTIGDKFKYMEETVYKQSTQPLYVLVDNNEKVIGKPRGYESGIEEYINWLDKGIEGYKNRIDK